MADDTNTATATTETSSEEGSILGGWMSKLGSLDEQLSPATPPATEAKQDAPQPPPAKPAETAEPAKQATTEPATTKDTAKPAETAKEDDDGAEKWPRSGADWDKFKKKRAEKEAALQAQIKERDTKIAEYEAKVKEYTEKQTEPVEPDPEIKAEVERLKKVNEEFSKIIAMNEITSHPDFREQFEAPLEKQRERLKRTLGEEKAAQLYIIQSLPEGDVKAQRKQEFLSELTPYEAGQLANIESKIEEITESRSRAIENAKIHREKLHAEQKTQDERVKAENQKLFKTVVKQVQDAKEGNPLFQMRDGDEKWNAGVKERIAMAEKVLFGGEGMGAQDIVKHSLNAAAYPALLASYKESLTQIEKLNEQVAALSAAQPSAGSGGTPSPAPQPTPKLSRDMNPFALAESFAKEMNRAMYSE